MPAAGPAPAHEPPNPAPPGWGAGPVSVVAAPSSFFTDAAVFPGGSAGLASALLMRRVPVTWAPLSDLRAEPAPVG